MRKKITPIIKCSLLCFLASLFLYVLSVVIVLNARHFKVVDPKDSNFKAEAFRVADYFNNKDVTFADAQVALFLGKKKEFVDYILIEKNNAKIRDEQLIVSNCSSKAAVSRVRYTLTPWWAWAMALYHLNLAGYSYGITACYDSDQVVVSLY